MTLSQMLSGQRPHTFGNLEDVISSKEEELRGLQAIFLEYKRKLWLTFDRDAHDRLLSGHYTLNDLCSLSLDSKASHQEYLRKKREFTNTCEDLMYMLCELKLELSQQRELPAGVTEGVKVGEGVQ